MLLSIIGNLLGGDDDGGGSDGDDPLEGVEGGMSSEPLMPEAVSGGGSDGDDDLLDDDLGGGGEFEDDLGGGGEFEDDFGGEGMLDGEEDFGGGEMSMGGMDGGGAVSSEVESRVEEMENEVGSLSSTVNTVQSENEQIGESLDEIEENIRKLLEVYEMVTQGVNPFVENDTMNEGFSGGGGSPADGGGGFGGGSLFDSGEETEEEDMDDEIANADAEDFLDESIIDGGEEEFEEEFGLEDDAEDFSDLEDEDESVAELDDGGDPAAATADGGSDEDLSFDELKNQFDSGDAEWAEGEADGEDDLEDESFADEGAFDDGDDAFEDGEDAFDDDAFEDDEALEDDGFADDGAFDNGGDDFSDEEAFEDDGGDGFGDEEAFDEESESADGVPADEAFDDEDDPADDALEDELSDGDATESANDDEMSVEAGTDEDELHAGDAAISNESEADREQSTAEAAQALEAEETAVKGSESTAEPETTPVTDSPPAATAATNDGARPPSGHSVAIPWDDGGRPYLESVPSDYETEFVVMDWLDDLVSEIGLAGATETIRLYGTLHWISEPVEEYLQTILKGFHGGPDVDEPKPRSPLGVDHARSLWWITQIQSPQQHNPSYEEWLEERGRTIVPAPASEESSWGSVVRSTDERARTEKTTEGASEDWERADEDTAVGFDDEIDGEDDVELGDDTALLASTGESVEEDPLLDEEPDLPEGPIERPDGAGEILEDDAFEQSTELSTGSEPATADAPGGGQRIEIDETAARSSESGQTALADDVEADDDMVWVDSETVVSAENLELSDLAGAVAATDLEARAADGDEAVKPMVDSDDHDLEPWQFELLQSVFTDGED